jgi:hypothetical protein
MTIHSDWARLLHDECPEAFYEEVPRDTRFDVGIIDGHLQLMCLNENFRSWEQFVWAVFVRPIQRLFEAGAPTVVLCFDAYDYVPVYKSMTQQKRVSRVSVCDFRPEQALPETIPTDAMEHLMNRNFKLKIVQLALERVPTLLQPTLAQSSERRLLIDYKTVVEYAAHTGETPRRIVDLAAMGESDVKYVRYVERYGNALVHAVDGDYLTIALLYYASGGVRDDNRIFLYRQLSRLNPSSTEEEALSTEKKTTSSKKRRAPTKGGKPKTPKCWVDMQLLYEVIAGCMRQAGAGAAVHPITQEAFSPGETVYAAVLLMLCAGTDFSRPLPLLGPRRLWEHLPLIAGALVHGAASSTSSPRWDVLGDAVVGGIYRAVFSNHVRSSAGEEATLRSTLGQLQTCKLAASTRARLPTAERVRVTLQNVHWVMRYWTAMNHATPAPLDGTYGFVRCPMTQRITFSDLCAR